MDLTDAALICAEQQGQDAAANGVGDLVRLLQMDLDPQGLGDLLDQGRLPG